MYSNGTEIQHNDYALVVSFVRGVDSQNHSEISSEVDYRLQRSRVLRDIGLGTIDRSEVCDPHPELLRVARKIAPKTSEMCPLCPQNELRLVAYVFGPRLGPSGKCVISDEEMQRIAKRNGHFVSYEIEVCAACGWNHLRRSYPIN